MEIYLVGGAIRDHLLGLPVRERDWVVVGETPESMVAQGYQPVGKDFPVFLHPETKEEYALARTERKSGKGYKGFIVNADPSVTLEEDLIRRDLTINAIAQTSDGEYIDPFKGREDLLNKTLRHVSDAFIEDPLRVLRAARFMARLGPLGFSIDESTALFMEEITKNGELDDLVAERVWREVHKALTEPAPERFFKTLEQCGALTVLFPEITQNCIERLENCTEKERDTRCLFAVLLSYLPNEKIDSLCTRIKVPNAYADLAKLFAAHHEIPLNTNDWSALKLLTLFKQLDAFRREARFHLFLDACGCLRDKDSVLPLRKLLKTLLDIKSTAFVEQGLQGEALGKAIDAARLEKIDTTLNTLRN